MRPLYSHAAFKLFCQKDMLDKSKGPREPSICPARLRMHFLSFRSIAVETK